MIMMMMMTMMRYTKNTSVDVLTAKSAANSNKTLKTR